MTSDNNSHLLPHEWDAICTEEDVSQILADTRSAKDADASKIHFFAFELRYLHQQFTAMILSERLLLSSHDGQLKRLPRTRPSRNLKTMQNAARKLRKLLDQEEYPLVHDALAAAAMSLDYPSSLYLTPFDFDKFYAQLKDTLKTLDGLIEHLDAKKLQFEDLHEGPRALWLVEGERPEELEVRRRLYPYLQKSEGIQPSEFEEESRYHEDPHHHLMRNIASLYEEMYGHRFNAVQRYDQPNFDRTSGEARYHGSCIRFACAIIKKLQLGDLVLQDSKTSGKTDQDRLINRIGDIWTNLPK
jgi:hypothetical protein